MRHILLATSVVFLAACSAPQIEAQAQYGLSKFDGDFAISSGGASGKTSMKDLGLDDEEGAPGARADFKWGLPHLTVELGKTSASGSGTTTANLSQGGTTITAGTAVDSDLDLGYIDGILTFDILPTDTVELGLGFGLQTLDIDAKVQQSGTANKVETSETFPDPRARAARRRRPRSGLLRRSDLGHVVHVQRRRLRALRSRPARALEGLRVRPRAARLAPHEDRFRLRGRLVRRRARRDRGRALPGPRFRVLNTALRPRFDKPGTPR
jgi:hypothetical protein